MQVFASYNSQSLWHDITASLSRWRQWSYLGKVDIIARYRRSVIGPFWVTITTGLMLLVIGGTYSYLWQGNTRDFFPFFAVGFILWTSLSNLLTESTEIYNEAAGYLQNYRAPKFFWVVRGVYRNFLTLLHMLPLYITVAAFFSLFNLAALPSLIAAATLYGWHCLWMATLVAMLATRFNDLKRLVPLLLSMMFLVTPILWQPESLTHHIWIYTYNPLYYIIELMRLPMLGEIPSAGLWLANVAIACVGSLAAAIAHKAVLKRVFYWL